jgi:undecaprenyl-diphosphatase
MVTTPVKALTNRSDVQSDSPHIHYGRFAVPAWALAAAAIVFLSLLVYGAILPSPEWEVDVMQGVQQASPPPLRWVAEFMTYAGASPWFQLTTQVAVGGLLLLKRPSLAVLVMGAFMLRALSPLLKDIIDRPRPSPESVDVASVLTNPSYPSGHVFGATLLYGVMIYAVEIAVPNLRIRRGIQAALLSLIGLMGYARVELGEHWPTDVVGGWAVGFLVVWCLIRAHDALTQRAAAPVRA